MTASGQGRGTTLRLRQADLADRPAIYRWLAQSDATAEMMGPPRFPDCPVPTWEEFVDDYTDEAFEPSGPFRLFVMVAGDRDIGAISHFTRERASEIDLWIADRSDWGHGHGVAAIRLLAADLFAGETVDALVIRPSARNARAIAAYRRAGFVPHDPDRHNVPCWVLTDGFDYDDAVVLVWPRGG